MPETVSRSRRELRRYSRKWRALDLVRILAGGGTAALLLREMADNIRAAKEYVDAINEFVAAYGWRVAIVLLWAVLVLAELIQHLMAEDASDGRWKPSGECDEAGEARDQRRAPTWPQAR